MMIEVTHPRVRTYPRMRTAIVRMRDVWAQLDYAQRRMFEIRTGLPLVEPPQPPRGRPRPTIARTVQELEALYASS